MADSVRIWNLLFLCSSICWICRTVWLEVRVVFYLDWNWKCSDWKSSGVGRSGKTDEGNDAALRFQNNAGFLREQIRKPRLKDCGVGDRVRSFWCLYTASIYNGLSRLFEMAFRIPYTVCVAGMAVFTGIYVILGGYMATAINDFIQGIIMLIGIVAVIAAVLSGQGGFFGSDREDG